jgi:hypothetical protein
MATRVPQGQIGPGSLAVVAAVLATSQHRPTSSGLLLTAIAAGAFLGSLLWTWRPIPQIGHLWSPPSP